MLKRKGRTQQASGKGLLRSSPGLSYIEVMVALVVMSIIILLVPAAILHSNKSTDVVSQKTIAESLTRTQIEYLKESEYVRMDASGTFRQGMNPGYATVPTPSKETYYLDINAWAVEPAPNSNFLEKVTTETGTQLITIKVYHLAQLFPSSTSTPTPIPTPLPDTYRPILVTSFYKVCR